MPLQDLGRRCLGNIAWRADLPALKGVVLLPVIEVVLQAVAYDEPPVRVDLNRPVFSGGHFV